MFDNIEEYEKDRQKYLRNKTSHGRFLNRVDKWNDVNKSQLIHLFWWFVHNCISHPIIGICPIKVAFRFHDYTSDKINLK